jgi:predicted dehydrogenase
LGGFKLDVGVIGTGSMGRNHARIYSELRDIGQVYIYDLNIKAAEQVAKGLDVATCDSMESLLREVDAVSICVPTKYHYPLIREVIDCSVHCLIEKPITTSSGEGEELLKAMDEDLVVGVGHIERFNPIVKEIKKLLVDPKYIEIRRHNPGSARITDSNVVVDLMIHDIDLVWNHFFRGEKNFDLYSVGNNNLFKTVANFGRCLVSLSASRIACSKIRTIHIEEDEFTVDGDFMTQEVYIHRKPDAYGETNTRYAQENIIEKVLINRVEPLKEELKNFLDCVKAGKQFSVTPEQAVLNLKIAESRGFNSYSRESPMSPGISGIEFEAPHL